MNKSINEIATELGILLIAEPLIDTLHKKSELKKAQHECLAIIYFARLTAIKYFFTPQDKCSSAKEQEYWIRLGEILDEICFKCIERLPMSKEYELELLASPSEYESARSEFFIYDLSKMHINIPTFYRGICSARHIRYTKALNTGFTINRKRGEYSAENWMPLASEVVNDLAPLSLRCELNEVAFSIAPSAVKACSIFDNYGLYVSMQK